MSGRRKNRPFYYAIKKDKLDELPIHDLLDMMRYDSAIPAPATQIYSIDHVEKISGIGNLDNIDSILDECYLFVNDVGPHLARWSSFGIRGKGAVIHCEGHSIWFQGKRPVYFIVKRDHFDKYELNYISGNEMADREELFKILWQDKAIIQANPPDGFYQFRAHQVSFEAWRKADLPVYVAAWDESDIRPLSNLGPQTRDVILGRKR